MESSVPTPPPNIMPLRTCPSADDTRKHRAIATPTRPTPTLPHNTRLTSPPIVVTGGTSIFVPVRNPYFCSSTPQPKTPSLSRDKRLTHSIIGWGHPY
eukprot:scaffold55169_cov79-Attheya_sp.AAC.1